MGRKKLTEKEKEISKAKRETYLKEWREKHSMDYYNKNKSKILKQQRQKREKEKGKPLNSHNLINYKNMSKEERNEYHRLKTREYRKRLKQKEKDYISKDKIREIIYGNYEDLEIILMIKELLEE